MKTACICSTKNEGDIIESFVRLNGKICDSFFFVDASTDKTREILGLLAAEEYDIHFLPASRSGHNQPNSTRALISAVIRAMDPDWIFLLDADEIIVAPDKQALLQELRDIPPNTFLTAPWTTYVPTSLAYFESSSPLSECFAMRKEEGESYRKVSIPGRLADDVIPTTGNHSVQSLIGVSLQEQLARSYYLAHFPVRSSEQIVVKNLIAMHNLMTRVDAAKEEGVHVFPVAEFIRSRGYTLTLEDAQNLAITYARPNQEPPASIASELDVREEPSLKTDLRYLQSGRINPLARLDAEVERLSNEIRGLRRGFKLRSVNFQAMRPTPTDSRAR